MYPWLRSPSAAFARMLALALLAGCSDDPVTESDNTPPSIASVEAIDVAHVRVTFSEPMDRVSTEDIGNYALATNAAMATAAAAPDAVVGIAALLSDRRTAMLTIDYLTTDTYTLTISGVSDAHGNQISQPLMRNFAGSDAQDTTPPEITFRAPGPGATDVALLSDVRVDFSENVRLFDDNGAPILWSAGAEPVSFSFKISDGPHLTITPREVLKPGTLYTITLVDAADPYGNPLPPASWSFRTTAQYDQSQPRIVSTIPGNLAANVSLQTQLTITFNRPVSQQMSRLYFFPDAPVGAYTWLNDQSTIMFDMILQPDQQYALVVLPGGLVDFNGVRNLEPAQVQFTTGPAVATGGVSGTITGDPDSDYTGQVAGAVVCAMGDPMSFLDTLAGIATVLPSGDYATSNLPDGDYGMMVVKDSNGDGLVDPERGDAFAYFGADVANADFDPDIVTVAGGGTVSSIDMALFDPSALTGRSFYSGVIAGYDVNYSVGLYDVNGFDPNASPDIFDFDHWYGDGTEFALWNFIHLIPDGTYYVRVVLDANDDSYFDPSVDPSGFYGGSTPKPVTILRGSDMNGMKIQLKLPTPMPTGPVAAWSAPATRVEEPAMLKRFSQMMSRNLLSPAGPAR